MSSRCALQRDKVVSPSRNSTAKAREIAGWIKAGKLKTREDIVEGFESFPETLLKLFRGENFGKLVLKV